MDTPADLAADVTIGALDGSEQNVVDLIAERMRLTLVEVLDEDRADEMFGHPELVDRVRWHLERTDPERRAAVYVARRSDGEVVGHMMVRVDDVDGFDDPVGLFATTYVTPEARRDGVASALLLAGESWMRQNGVDEAITFTDPDNVKLFALYRRHGYRWEIIDDNWARARRRLR